MVCELHLNKTVVTKLKIESKITKRFDDEAGKKSLKVKQNTGIGMDKEK